MKLKAIIILAAVAGVSMAANANRGVVTQQRPTTGSTAPGVTANASVVSGIVNAVRGSVVAGGAAAAIVNNANVQNNMGLAMDNQRLASVIQRYSSEIQQQNVTDTAESRKNIELLSSVIRAAAAFHDTEFSVTGHEADPTGYSGDMKIYVKAVLELVLGDRVINSIRGNGELDLASLERFTGILNDFSQNHETLGAVDAAAEHAMNNNGYEDAESAQNLDVC
jgi:hypothetical protein